MSAPLQLAMIGGGPAGLRAAEVAAAAGVSVTLFDAKPSVGRKFLVAGKGGLNLTHGEALDRFVARYHGPDQPPGIWNDLLKDFDATALREWARVMGVETFQATSGRVYPKALKAAPLLRHWIMRLKKLGVRFEMNHAWRNLIPGTPHVLEFSNNLRIEAESVVFALGGGSWPRTGSDGGWLTAFQRLGIECNPLVPANCGWEHEWSPEILATAEGKPLKNLRVTAGESVAVGELLITRYGLEGGAIYQLGAALRAMPRPAIAIDFKPDLSHARLVAKMESVRHGFLQQARVRWRLSEVTVAILGQREWRDADTLANEVKHCVIPLTGPRPLDEAISSAGGVCWHELNSALMLKRFPGIFLAGEMIDWEAPTGGYLMQGCFATGTRSGTAAAQWLRA